MIILELHSLLFRTSNLDTKYQKLRDITAKAMSGQRKERPTVDEWLSLRDNWTLNYSEVRQQIIETIDVNKEYEINTEFIHYFLKTKHIYNK